RPPKILDFRISRREITVFFALRRLILPEQNQRATSGRPYGYFFDKLKSPEQMFRALIVQKGKCSSL
ncbi:MAG: hypothetical protein IKD27_02360, partial [Oscillospiraceae bacterium]|nr:hypothetical protein [Oscillospiraceae bacterium]